METYFKILEWNKTYKAIPVYDEWEFKLGVHFNFTKRIKYITNKNTNEKFVCFEVEVEEIVQTITHIRKKFFSENEEFKEVKIEPKKIWVNSDDFYFIIPNEETIVECT